MILRLFTLVFCCAATAAAQLKFERESINLRAEPGASEARTSYVFTNAGSKTVTITGVATSCDCTTSALKKKSFAPGESGELPVVFAFDDREGPQRKLITVQTDEPTEYRLSLEVDIPVLAAVAPRLLFWRGAGPYAAKDLRITPEPSQTVIAVGWHLKGDGFRIEPLAPDNQGVRVLRITPTSATEESRVEATIEVVSGQGRKLNYQVFLRVLPVLPNVP